MKLWLHQENESTFGLSLLTFNDLPQGKTNEPILHYKEKREGREFNLSVFTPRTYNIKML